MGMTSGTNELDHFHSSREGVNARPRRPRLTPLRPWLGQDDGGRLLSIISQQGSVLEVVFCFNWGSCAVKVRGAGSGSRVKGLEEEGQMEKCGQRISMSAKAQHQRAS